MPARTGSEYLQRLRDGREIWVDGARVKDVTEHPQLARAARSIAALYDLQHRAELRERMLFPEPSRQELVGLAFLQPRGTADLERRRLAFKAWADFSGGLLGRAPDFMSTMLTAMASASDFFARAQRAFGDNLLRFYAHCRDNDLCLTHALSKPVSDQSAPLKIVGENDRGLLLSGTRALATLAPFADEMMVFPGPSPGQHRQGDAAAYAVACCVPVATPGLKFLCRESLDFGRPVEDHPLASRFDEQDAVVVFEKVLVPWERVFLKGDGEHANALWRETQALPHGIHQFLVKNQAKAEFVLGVASLVAEGTGVDQHAHVQGMLGEVVDAIETLRAFIRAAEVDAVPGPGGTVVPNPDILETARNYFPVVYPRLIEILQLIGASGHIAHVPEATASGELADAVEAYYRAPKLGGQERVRLFKLAWDLSCSGFAGRQVLYERFFDGDLFRKRATRYASYARKEQARERVRDFLARPPGTRD